MLKHEEASDPDSCWNKADDNEEVFVLLGRDIATPMAIMRWIEMRVLYQKNKASDMQIQGAYAITKRLIKKNKEKEGK